MRGRSISLQGLRRRQDSNIQWNSCSPHDDSREDVHNSAPDIDFDERPQPLMRQGFNSKDAPHSIIVYEGNTHRYQDKPAQLEVFNPRPNLALLQADKARPSSAPSQDVATLVNNLIDDKDREHLTSSIPSDISHQDRHRSGRDLSTSLAEEDFLVGDDTDREIPWRVERAVRQNRKNRAALSYHVSRCREEIKYSSAARDYFINLVAILFQQLGIDSNNPSSDPSNRLMRSARDIHAAIDRLNTAQTSLDDIAFELKQADDSLRISDERVKELVIPDDDSDHLDIFDRVLEGLSLPVEHTTIVFEDTITVVEIRLSLLQRQSLREALSTRISDPLGIIDLDELLADQPLPSVSDHSPGDELLDLSSHAPILSRGAVEIEFEVSLLGIQFAQREYASHEEFSTEKDGIQASPLQWQKRSIDIMEREQAGFFEDFWQICRTSWLEFSRLLEYVDYLVDIGEGHFEVLRRLSPSDIDRYLRDVEGEHRVHDPARATDHALRFTTSRWDSLRATMLPQPGLSLLSDHVSHSYRSPINILKLRPTTERVHPKLVSRNKMNSIFSRHPQSVTQESLADELNSQRQQQAPPKAPAERVHNNEHVVKRRQTSSWPADRSNASQTAGRMLPNSQQLNEASST